MPPCNNTLGGFIVFFPSPPPILDICYTQLCATGDDAWRDTWNMGVWGEEADTWVDHNAGLGAVRIGERRCVIWRYAGLCGGWCGRAGPCATSVGGHRNEYRKRCGGGYSIAGVGGTVLHVVEASAA